MKKYFKIFQISLKDQTYYRFDVLSNILFSIFPLALNYILWTVVYNDRYELHGFTFPMIMTYYVLINFLSKLDVSMDESQKLAQEIRIGNFSKFIVRPISVFTYYLTIAFSRMAYTLLYNLLGTFLWCLLFLRQMVAPTSAIKFLMMIAVFLLGQVFSLLFNYLLAVLAFWIDDVTAFFMIEDHIYRFVTGVFVPIALLPPFFIGLFKYLPFYYLYYYPITIYFGIEDVPISQACIVLVVWTALLTLLVHITYKKATKSYTGVGI